MVVSHRVVLRFPPSLVDQPIVYRLTKDFGLEFNILKASIIPKEQGFVLMELSGEEENYKKGMCFLAELGVEVQPISQDVVRNESRCTHCGACVALCPTGALHVEGPSRWVAFDSAKCIACELCILACPPRAMEVRF